MVSMWHCIVTCGTVPIVRDLETHMNVDETPSIAPASLAGSVDAIFKNLFVRFTAHPSPQVGPGWVTAVE